MFICPFNIDRLTGTPIRAKIVTESVSQFANINIFSEETRVAYFSYKAIKKLRELRPDIIHAFTTVSIISALIYKIAFNHRVKIIFEMHGWSWFETKGQLGILKRIILIILDTVGYIFSNVVIVMSYTQKEYLAKILYDKKNMDVIWGPVDFPISFEAPGGRESILVGYQGNSSWWQGLHILLDSAKILENTGIKFQLAGFDSSDKSKFPDRPNITYLGRFERKDVGKLIKNCDVMVSPRLANKVSDLQYPQKLSEYLAGGRPVIAFNTSDQKMIVEQADAGFVIKRESAEDLAQAIDKYSKLSDKTRIKLGENAARFAQDNFSIGVFTEKYKRAYEDLAK